MNQKARERAAALQDRIIKLADAHPDDIKVIEQDIFGKRCYVVDCQGYAETDKVIVALQIGTNYKIRKLSSSLIELSL